MNEITQFTVYVFTCSLWQTARNSTEVLEMITSIK